MAVSVINKTHFKINPVLFKKAFNYTLKFSKKRTFNTGVSVVIVGDKEIKKINKEYRRKNKPTDVLSFGFLEKKDIFQKIKGDIIGEIFISAETAEKQAEKLKHSTEKECLILFVHGFLHILGFDHKKNKEASVMQKLEQKILLKMFKK